MSPKFNLILHSLSQLAAQALVMGEVTDPIAKSILSLIVAVVGVFAAFRDQSLSKSKDGEQQ